MSPDNSPRCNTKEISHVRFLKEGFLVMIWNLGSSKVTDLTLFSIHCIYLFGVNQFEPWRFWILLANDTLVLKKSREILATLLKMTFKKITHFLFKFYPDNLASLKISTDDALDQSCHSHPCHALTSIHRFTSWPGPMPMLPILLMPMLIPRPGGPGWPQVFQES